MNVHKVISRLREYIVDDPHHKSFYEDVIDRIITSMKFEFQPDILPTEMDFLTVTELGHSINLPFDRCYFEFANKGSVLMEKSIIDSHIIDFIPFARKENGNWYPLDLNTKFYIDKRESGFSAETNNSKDIDQTEIIKKIVSSLISFIIGCIAVLNCSNVSYQNHEPSFALNKKRLRSGKVPLFSFQTLVISLNKVSSKSDRNDAMERSSPRFHLRRGHIRRLQDNKTIWVQSCTVGDVSSGIVHKNYHVTK